MGKYDIILNNDLTLSVFISQILMILYLIFIISLHYKNKKFIPSLFTFILSIYNVIAPFCFIIFNSIIFITRNNFILLVNNILYLVVILWQSYLYYYNEIDIHYVSCFHINNKIGNIDDII